jgi:hypothetical protein
MKYFKTLNIYLSWCQILFTNNYGSPFVLIVKSKLYVQVKQRLCLIHMFLIHTFNNIYHVLDLQIKSLTKMASSGMLRCVALVRPDVSDELSA